MRSVKDNQETVNKAIDHFKEGLKKFDSKEDFSIYARMMCTLSGQLITGLHGKDFQKGFLHAASEDTTEITVKSTSLQ